MKVRNEIKVGVVVLIAAGLAYFGLNYLKGSDIFSNARYFYALYDDVDGLSADDKVVFNGVKVGRVSSTKLLPEKGNQILVQMEILEEQLRIPDSTTAMISNLDVLGTKGIVLEFPVWQSFDDVSDTLESKVEKGLQTVIEEKLAPLQSQLEELITRTSDLIATVQITVGEIEHTVQTAEGAIKTINTASHDIDKMVVEQNERLTVIFSNVASITGNLRANTDKINDILANVATISDSLTRANYSKAVTNASSALEQVDSLITKINSGEGSLGLLLNDPKLYEDLQQAAVEVDKLVEDIRVNPKRYFSPLGKREKSKDKPSKKARDANGRAIQSDEDG